MIFTKRDACELKNQHELLACGVHTLREEKMFKKKRGVRFCTVHARKMMDAFPIMGCFPDNKLDLPAPPVRAHADGKF